MPNNARALLLLICMLAGLAFANAAVAAASVKALRVSQQADRTWLALEFSQSVAYTTTTLTHPDRLVVDLPSTRLAADLSQAALGNSPVLRIRSGVHNGTDLRLVFDLRQKTPARLHWQDNHLIVELTHSADAAPAQASQPAPVMRSGSAARDVVIVIDAGHGGKDPGAIGPGRLMEKNVVLPIARELAALFRRERGYTAVLTRNSDVFLPLKTRRDLAREASADLFVSIHADAFTNARARGGSIYALSTSGASSTMAAFLAASENNADAIGGVSVQGKDDYLVKVLADLSMTATLDTSLRIGDQVLGAMDQIATLHSRRVEQAGFVVLKSPDTPSILVETGFISNPEEARKLSSASYQKQMAQVIFRGINQHFVQSPPPNTYLAQRKRGNGSDVRQYTIARGDTLSDIAQRYGVSVASLQASNRLDSGLIRVGQTLVIPGTET